MSMSGRRHRSCQLLAGVAATTGAAAWARSLRSLGMSSTSARAADCEELMSSILVDRPLTPARVWHSSSAPKRRLRRCRRAHVQWHVHAPASAAEDRLGLVLQVKTARAAVIWIRAALHPALAFHVIEDAHHRHRVDFRKFGEP